MNEYRGYTWEMDTESSLREDECTIRIDYDDNLVKAYLDQPLNDELAKIKAEAFIDGYIKGLEIGQEIGKDLLALHLHRWLKEAQKVTGLDRTPTFIAATPIQPMEKRHD